MEQKPADENQGGGQQPPEIMPSSTPPAGTPPGPDKICPNCGAASPSAAVYCFKCGAKLPDAAIPDKKICSGCHAVNSAAAQYCYKCGLPLPQTLSTGYENQMRYAGFWIRLVAWFIDIIIIGIVADIVTVPLFIHYIGFSGNYSWLTSGTLPASFWTYYGWALLTNFIVDIVYYTVAIGKWGKTLGKLAVKIKVVKPDGSRVSYWRALGRSLANYLNAFTFGLMYLVIAFTSKKRGVHDYIADTVVIKTD